MQRHHCQSHGRLPFDCCMTLRMPTQWKDHSKPAANSHCAASISSIMPIAPVQTHAAEVWQTRALLIYLKVLHLPQVQNATVAPGTMHMFATTRQYVHKVDCTSSLHCPQIEGEAGKQKQAEKTYTHSTPCLLSQLRSNTKLAITDGIIHLHKPWISRCRHCQYPCQTPSKWQCLDDH